MRITTVTMTTAEVAAQVDRDHNGASPYLIARRLGDSAGYGMPVVVIRAVD